MHAKSLRCVRGRSCSLESVDTIESKLRKGEPGLSGGTKGIIESLDATLARIRQSVASEICVGVPRGV